MSLQTLLSIIAASIGFVSALWFCIGAVLITPAEIAKAADDSFNASPDVSGTLISQSAEYLAGGLLLAMSFGFQIAAAQATSTNLLLPCPVLLSAWVSIPATVAASFLLSYPVFALRKKILLRKVQALK